MSYTKGLRVGFAGSTGTSIIDEAGFCVATVFPPDLKDGRNYDTETAMEDALMFVAAGLLREYAEVEERRATWKHPNTWRCGAIGDGCYTNNWCACCVEKLNAMRRAAIALAKGEKP